MAILVESSWQNALRRTWPDRKEEEERSDRIIYDPKEKIKSIRVTTSLSIRASQSIVSDEVKQRWKLAWANKKRLRKNRQTLQSIDIWVINQSNCT